VFLPVDTAAYEAASAEVMAALAEFDAVVEVAGWDEAFLAADTDDPEALARRIQDRIRAVTSLECTVGIGENKLQAKLAAGFGKPAGIFRLTHQSWYAVLGDRPTDALWGVGPKTARRLAALGIHTVADLAGTDPRDLAGHLGPVTGPWLVQTARGLSPAPVDAAPYVPRSHGQEVTFQHDITDWEQVRNEVTRLARQVAAGIAGGQRPARRVVVKVRYAPFITRTHGHPLPAATSDAAAIERAALAALGQFRPGRPVRLLGVRAEFTR
jgi:DNA polymerase-4